MRIAASAVLGLVLIVASCGDSGEDREEVRGIVLEVEGDLASVESFLLRTDDGELLRVVPAPDGDFRFPLPHLHDHRRTAEPLLVELDRSYDPPRATAIEDAGNPAWHGETRSESALQDAVEPEGSSVAGQEDTAPPPPVTEDLPRQREDAPSAPPASGAETDTGDEPGSGSSPTSTTEGRVEEPGVEVNVTEATRDGPGRSVQEPEGSGDRPDHERIEDGVEPEEPPGPVIDLVLIDGNLDGGARRESVAMGEIVTIRVSGNSNDEVHVHGYDLFVELVDGAGELTFEASIPGIFEIELEGSHTLLVRLEVS